MKGSPRRLIMINRKNLIYLFIFLPVLFCFSFTKAAEEGNNKGDFIIPSVTEAPLINGLLDDKCWSEAIELSLDFQTWPGDNTKPSEKTSVYMGYDKENIYIAFHAFSTEKDSIRCTIAKRDSISADDTVSIYFDTYYDRRNYYLFSFNPLGIQADARNGDYNWDTQFTSKGILADDGYTVEVCLPFSSIKFPELSIDTLWGLRITRSIPSKGETVSWKAESRDIPDWQQEEGTFCGFQDINIGHPVQIIPVIVTSSTGEKDEDNNFSREPFNIDPGINFKIGLTSTITLDATLNPDFSQVEADAPQIDVNTRFPIYIPEKRPFFLEGRDIFETPLMTVYTRNIVKPEGGLKLTGKAGKNTIGFIMASDSAPGDLYEPGDPEYKENALFTILRMKRDIFEESQIGFIFTDREFADSHNRVYGIDGELKFGQYSLNFQGLNSDTGDEDGSLRYGGASDMTFNYTGRNLYYGLSHTSVDPDFQADTGFIYRTGYKKYSTWLGYDFLAEDDTVFLRALGTSVYGDFYYDYNGNLTESSAGTDIYFELANQTNFGGYAYFDYLKYGGIDFYPSIAGVSFYTSYSKTISGGFNVYWGKEVNYDPDRLLMGNSSGFNMTVNVRPGENFRNTFTYSRGKLSDPVTDEIIYDVSIFRNALTYQFNRDLAFRNIIDYNSYGHRLGINLLFTWTPNPGTVFFAGYNKRYFQNDLGMYDTEGDMFFMKMSYLFQL